ncbi:MAG: O-antigen ligase C-terminal domain-containing protein [Methylophaga sp.]|nr:O-antigen ligase C-terminal domain-containing protein [Methylophaga sp.]
MKISSLPTLKPIEWLLGVLLLLAPFYFHPNIGGTGFRIPNNIVIRFFASVIGFYSLYKFSQAEYFYIPRYFLFIIAFPILAFFSGMSAGVEIANQWVFRLLYIWGGLLFFFGLYQHGLKQGRIDRILFLIVISGLLHALVGLAQIVLVKNIPTWLPINPNGIPTGLFQQINNQASFQITSILTALWLSSRPYIKHGKSWRFWLILLSIGLGAFIVSYSGSRVAALAFIFALPLLLLSRWHQITIDKKRWWLIASIILISIFSSNILNNSKHGNSGITSVIEKTTAMNSGFSGSSRLGIYTIAYDAFKEQPIFGHGIGSFIRVWQLGKPQFYADHPNANLPNQRVAHPHNETIFWLMEGGLVAGIGLLLFLIAILLTLKNLPPCRRYAYAALLLPITLHTQVELPFYISASHWFVFLIILFAIMHPYNHRRRVILSAAARMLIKVLVIFGGLSVAIFLSHTMASTLEFKDFILKKSSADKSFPVSIQNPYFKQLATETMITSLFYASAKHGLDDNVRAFAEWSEQELKANPHILYYKLTVEALSYLQKNKHACAITREGLTIYPDDEALQTIRGRCEEINL